jgi:hypothetical protein
MNFKNIFSGYSNNTNNPSNPSILVQPFNLYPENYNPSGTANLPRTYNDLVANVGFTINYNFEYNIEEYTPSEIVIGKYLILFNAKNLSITGFNFANDCKSKKLKHKCIKTIVNKNNILRSQISKLNNMLLLDIVTLCGLLKNGLNNMNFNKNSLKFMCVNTVMKSFTNIKVDKNAINILLDI